MQSEPLPKGVTMYIVHAEPLADVDYVQSEPLPGGDYVQSEPLPVCDYVQLEPMPGGGYVQLTVKPLHVFFMNSLLVVTMYIVQPCR